MRGFWLTNPNSSNKDSQQRGALAVGHIVAPHSFRGVVIMLAVILNLGVSTPRTIEGLLVCLGSFFWKFVSSFYSKRAAALCLGIMAQAVSRQDSQILCRFYCLLKCFWNTAGQVEIRASMRCLHSRSDFILAGFWCGL